MPSATLRFNLDPSQLASDEIIIDALKLVQLWQFISTSSDVNARNESREDVLGTVLSSLQTFSAGQIQLLAVVRAIIKRRTMHTMYTDDEEQTSNPKPILLMDEATSTFDQATEAFINDVIDEEFVANGHTVVAVTHRLDILSRKLSPNRDLIAWMKDGTIEKLGSAEEVIRMGIVNI
jgi:ATP-binding cassette, subfamily C (CFTR/MRP), member 1